MWVTLATVTFISTVGAVQTLQWTAEQYYHDAESGHDGYYEFNPNRGQPGQPRLLKVPPQNATACSGFGGDCKAQETFTRNTYKRARVELAGVGIAWVAVVIYFVVFVYACITVHRLRIARRELRRGSRREQTGVEVRRILAEKEASPLNYRYI